MDASPPFGTLLRQLRKARDLSQEALAQQAACAHDTVKKLERGLRRPSRELAIHLADIFRLVGTQRETFLAAARAPLPAGQVPEPPVPTPLPYLHARRLPTPATPFIGRVDEQAQLMRLLTRADTRLVTILAPGGMGKTRLALAAAELLVTRGAFAEGAAFVDLTPLESPANLDAAVAAALGLRLDPNPERTPRAQLLDYLREKRLLIVLDNCEHLRIAVGEMALAILGEASRTMLLTTTRERLGLQAEQVFRLEGFQSEADSIALFAATARAVQQHFVLDATSKRLVEQICARLGGMPLAIELAAGWADTLGLDEIAAEVARGDELLVATAEDRPTRHQSVRAVFFATWAWLAPAERAAFAPLAVFHGGATRRALQAVTGADLATLKALVGKALLRYDIERERYSVHELLRQYAAEQLAEETLAQRVAHQRHAAHYLAALAEREPRLKSVKQQAALDEIGKDLENVRAAWEWVVDERQWHLLAPAAVTTLGYALQWRAAYEDGLARFAAAADALAASSHIPLLLLALLRGWQGAFSVMLGRRVEAGVILQQAWGLLPTQSDDARYACIGGFILLQQGLSVQYDGIEQVERILTQSIAAYDIPEARWEQSAVLVALANHLQDQGRFADAEQHYSSALSIREAYGDRRGTADVLQRQSQIAAEKGLLDDALDLAQRALAIYQELGDVLSNATGWGQLGVIQQWLGAYPESERSLRRSLEQYRQLGEPNSIAFGRVRLAITLNAFAAHHEALAELNPALSVLRQHKSRWQEARALWVAGSAYAGLEEWDKAEACYKESIATYRAINLLGQSSWPIAALAHMELRRGNIPPARAYLVEALAPTGDQVNYLAAFYVVAAAARVLECYGRSERALELYEMFQITKPAITKTRYYQQRFVEWHAALRAALPAEVVAAAEERGWQLDVWATVESLRQELAELEGETFAATPRLPGTPGRADHSAVGQTPP